MACTLFLRRLFSVCFFIFIAHSNICTQTIVCFFDPDSSFCYLKQQPYQNKVFINTSDSTAILLALRFYPELKNTKIQFVTKNTLTPLSARPSFLSIFKKARKRKYKIIISKRSIQKLDPIIFKNLTFNSQIGVIGHELAHIADFNKMKLKHFIKLAFKHFSKRSMDSFEFNTDKSCIEHGLGHQLLSWSEEVRVKLAIQKWGGANNPVGEHERYMNPSTIIKYYNSLSIYK